MIPKSLHTVTVLVAMAKYMKASVPGGSDTYYLHLALATLNYGFVDDKHPLILQALKKMGKA